MMVRRRGGMENLTPLVVFNEYCGSHKMRTGNGFAD